MSAGIPGEDQGIEPILDRKVKLIIKHGETDVGTAISKIDN